MVPEAENVPEVRQVPEEQKVPEVVVEQVPEAEKVPEVEQVPEEQKVPAVNMVPEVEKFPEVELGPGAENVLDQTQEPKRVGRVEALVQSKLGKNFSEHYDRTQFDILLLQGIDLVELDEEDKAFLQQFTATKILNLS